MVDEGKLRAAFPNTTVYKDRQLISVFRASSIPAFLRDWIIRKKADASGRIADVDALRKYMADVIPGREDVLSLKDAARSSGASRKFLARVNIQLNVRTNTYSFEIPDLGISYAETVIEDYVWDRIKDDVLATAGGWGLVQLGYLRPEENAGGGGKLSLLEFRNFCPYTVNLEVFKRARASFTTEEWFDVLLGAIDYNPQGYRDWVEKHTMLTRLLPFVEPRVNLVELAPKGTGKSYLFGRVGKYGWLVSGGTLSRAKMFFDMAKRQPGIVATSDFVALDEIQSIQFPDSGEMQGALKAYMESGEATFGDKRIVGSAGVILLGNIPQDDMDVRADMFRSLPEVFHESALLDRFHGFIRGRDIPRMNETLKIDGWALNTEYFCEILHLLRSPAEGMLYGSVVEELVEYPKGADTRDTTAILRLCTAFVKFLFPHVTCAEQMDVEEFRRYCLNPAIAMRTAIRNQLQIIDPKEFGGKNVAVYAVRRKFLDSASEATA